MIDIKYMTILINWVNDEVENIDLTVGLPIYEGKKIVWLALESLKNQIDIDFNWELIIWEEYGKSKDIIDEFVGKLPGCKRILYKSIDKKITLLQKWRGIVRDSSEKSEIFVLQDADDYSPPGRLKIHFEHFKNEDCYFSTQVIGLFYNLKTKKKIFYYGVNKENKRKEYFSNNHLNKAVRMRDMKRLPASNIKRYVDNYIKVNIERMNKIRFTNKKYVYTDLENDRDTWKKGFFTDGANQLSKERAANYLRPRHVFIPYMYNSRLGYNSMEEYIPENVIKFLENYT